MMKVGVDITSAELEELRSLVEERQLSGSYYGNARMYADRLSRIMDKLRKAKRAFDAARAEGPAT